MYHAYIRKKLLLRNHAPDNILRKSLNSFYVGISNSSPIFCYCYLVVQIKKMFIHLLLIYVCQYTYVCRYINALYTLILCSKY